MKTALYGYRADIAGLLWLAVALFLALALGSYHPTDPSLNAIGFTLPVQNKCGYLGSFLADFLYQSLGWGAWVLVVFAIKNSIQAFKRKPRMTIAKQSIMFVLSLTTIASLFELHQSKAHSPFPNHITPGGLLGQLTIQTLTPYLHFAGLCLLFWSMGYVLVSIYTKSSLSVLMIKSIKAFGVVALQIGEGIHTQITHLPKNILQITTSIKTLFTKKPSTSHISHITDDEHDMNDIEEDTYFDDNEPDTVVTTSTLEPEWTLPTPDMLKSSSDNIQINEREINTSAERLIKKLEQFSISGEITDIHSGPMITLFEFKPEDHVKVARISQMEDDLMMALKSQSIRILAPIPGKDVVGIETAHAHRQTVYLKNLIDEPTFWQRQNPLPLVLGRHVDGRAGIVNLRQIPHLMVAGSTGSGKSVFVVSFLLSLLFRHTPQTLKLLLVDPKRVDLTVFESLPHLLAEPIKESKTALSALTWCLSEMDKRYRSLARFHVRDLEDFNERTGRLSEEEKRRHTDSMANLEKRSEYYFTPQPYICIVLEEFGDLMSSQERNAIERAVVRLAQMARACGLHLILSMQSPRKDVVTGLIKTNIPGRISFKVSSRVDSRIILDEGGAERLLTQGDMLYLGPGQPRAIRYHGPFVKEKEAIAIIRYWKKQNKNFSYPLSFTKNDQTTSAFHSPLNNQEDDTYTEVFNYVSELKEVSASQLQRRYGLGYPRAARLIDRLEEEGVVGPSKGSKPREVLANR